MTNKYKFKSDNKIFFGGNKLKVLQRDRWICQKCGMTNQQHILLFGRNIGVHHIDNKGRNSKEKNNNIENLITMCVQCHIKKHNPCKEKKRYGIERTRKIEFDDFYDNFDGDEDGRN